MFTIDYHSYTGFVRSGYKERGYEGLSRSSYNAPGKKLTELKADDLTMVGLYFDFYFDHTKLSPGIYDIEITMINTEGKGKVANCEVKIEEPKKI